MQAQTNESVRRGRLLAAAPKMLAALDALVQAVYEGKTLTPYSTEYRKALDAIQAAKGI